jgi:hypothetical protein
MSRSRGRNRGRPAIAGRPQVRAYATPGQPIDLGDLTGEVVEPVYATFSYFGERYRVNPDLTETLVVDLLAEAAHVDLDDPRSAGRTEPTVAQNAERSKDYVRQHLHPDDFEEFWRVAKANRQSVEALLALCWRLLALVAERPTTPPSDSSAGRPITSQNLPDGASSLVADEAAIDGSWWPEELPRNDSAIRVVEQFEARGRPDLANQIMVTQEQMAAASVVRTG